LKTQLAAADTEVRALRTAYNTVVTDYGTLETAFNEYREANPPGGSGDPDPEVTVLSTEDDGELELLAIDVENAVTAVSDIRTRVNLAN
jgi:hypothetical protein